MIKESGMAIISPKFEFISGNFLIKFAKAFIKNQIKIAIAIGVKISLKLLKAKTTNDKNAKK